jgi:hypothetical protein
MDMGREDRESEREREGVWPGEGEARSLLYVSRAVADGAKADEGGAAFVGDAGAGDAGPGVEMLEGGCFCRWAPPPHCDMKDRTAAGAVLVRIRGDTARRRGGDTGKVRAAAFIYLSWGDP